MWGCFKNPKCKVFLVTFFTKKVTPRGERKDNLIISKGHGKCKFRDLVLFACSDKLEVIYRSARAVTFLERKVTQRTLRFWHLFIYKLNLLCRQLPATALREAFIKPKLTQFNTS